MDTRNGLIHDMLAYSNLPDEEKQHFIPIEPTEQQVKRVPPRVLYNEPCPCGSGKMFRKCCFSLTRRKQ